MVTAVGQTNKLLVTEVPTAAVSLCRTIKLVNLFDVESGDELLPDLRSEAVTKHHSDLVLVLELCDGGGVEIPRNLSNILGTLSTNIFSFDQTKTVQLTVTWFLTQSSQNLVAENFFLVTAVFPSVIVTPRQTWAAEW